LVLEILKPVIKLGLGALASLLVHLTVRHFQEIPLWAHFILAAYLANLLLAIGITIFLIKAPHGLRNSLGFLFMLGSGLKFILFFAFFYPLYKADGDMSRPEFFTFFIPYAVCLFFETQSLIRILGQRSP
tara:strand:+ start:1172 stop:1561 length:390 start_codon:yes stop_codon:yes gene_type:complete